MVHNWTLRSRQKCSAIIHVLQNKNFWERKGTSHLSTNSVLSPALAPELASSDFFYFYFCFEQHLTNTAGNFVTAVLQYSRIWFLHGLYMVLPVSACILSTYCGFLPLCKDIFVRLIARCVFRLLISCKYSGNAATVNRRSGK